MVVATLDHKQLQRWNHSLFSLRQPVGMLIDSGSTILDAIFNLCPNLLQITRNLSIGDDEIEMSAIRAQGAGGQNVNKVASAIHLRFDIRASSLPELYKSRLLALGDQRVSKEGVIIIKAQQFRTQEKNRLDALQRLRDMIRTVAVVKKARKPTRPTRNSRLRRLDGKTRRAKTKQLRGKPTDL